MYVSKEVVIKILRYLLSNTSFYFPFKIVCVNFDEDDEMYEIQISEDILDRILNNDNFKDFNLVENLQHLDLETLELMSKGFIEKIINEDVISIIENSAKGYRELWKLDLCESAKIEEYGLNEFFGGKAEGFEESLDILKNSRRFFDQQNERGI